MVAASAQSEWISLLTDLNELNELCKKEAAGGKQFGVKIEIKKWDSTVDSGA